MEPITDPNFTIKFDGQQHQIDANILISSLVHTTTIIQELNKHLNTGKKIDIKINSLEKGSFLIYIELVESLLDDIKNIFTRENINTTGAIIGGIVGLIDLKKHLCGESPSSVEDKGDSVIVSNSNNISISINTEIYNIYENNPLVNEAISQNFELLDNDVAITGFEITNKHGKPYVVVEKEDFKNIAIRSNKEQAGTRFIKENAKLNIVRVSFETNLKWDFYYKGIKVSAKIIDPSFYELIDKGEPFSKGDILEVELQINQIFDSGVNTFINKSYQVNKFHNIIRRGEQKMLF